MRLRRRAEFQAVAKGVRVGRDAFTVQALRRPSEMNPSGEPPRVGFTVTKKVGSAPLRNRIRRRLRALSDRMAGEFVPATDYVIVARIGAASTPFDRLGASLAEALSAATTKLDRATTTRTSAAHRPVVRRRADPAAEA